MPPPCSARVPYTGLFVYIYIYIFEKEKCEEGNFCVLVPVASGCIAVGYLDFACQLKRLLAPLHVVAEKQTKKTINIHSFC